MFLLVLVLGGGTGVYFLLDAGQRDLPISYAFMFALLVWSLTGMCLLNTWMDYLALGEDK